MGALNKRIGSSGSLAPCTQVLFVGEALLFPLHTRLSLFDHRGGFHSRLAVNCATSVQPSQHFPSPFGFIPVPRRFLIATFRPANFGFSGHVVGALNKRIGSSGSLALHVPTVQSLRDAQGPPHARHRSGPGFSFETRTCHGRVSRFLFCHKVPICPILDISTQSVPKRRIGGSGSSSSVHKVLLYGHSLFSVTCICAEVFFRSLLLLGFAALVQMYIRPSPGRCTPLGRLLRVPTAFAPIRCLIALGVATPAQPVLRWHNAKPARATHGTARSSVLGTAHTALRLLIFGACTLPTPVWSAPTAISAFGHFIPDPGPMSGPVLAASTPEPLPENAMLGSVLPAGAPEPLLDIDPRWGHVVDLPPIAAATPPYPPASWLGVVVYAPYHPTVAFGLHLPSDTDLQQALLHIRHSDRLPCAQHDSLVPVRPQPMPGYLAVLTYPSIIALGRRPHVAIVLDLARVGGTCYATTFPADVTAWEMLDSVRTQLNVDFEDEPLHVWVGTASQPASCPGALALAHGTLVTVMRAFVPAQTVFLAENLFQPERDWTRLDHVPKPSNPHCLAVCQDLRIFSVVLAFFPRFFKADIALQVTKHTRDTAKVVFVDNEPPLDLLGEPCLQTAVVLPVPPGGPTSAAAEPRKANTPVAYFLDVRLLGISPRLVIVDDSLPDLPDIIAAADIQIPDGYSADLISNHIIDNLQHLKIGLTIDLAHRVFPGISDTGPTEPTQDPITAASPTIIYNASRAGNHHRLPHGRGIAPERPPRPRPFVPEQAPDAHEALALADGEETLVEFVNAYLVVFAPRFKHEIYPLALPVPCDSEAALLELTEARDTDMSLFFDCLIPAIPQPDHSFACLLALPAWANVKSCCLVDTRAIDGRLFAMCFAAPLARSSILLHIGVPDSPGLRVFAGGRELATQGLHPIAQGETVLVLPPDAVHVPNHTFQQMLNGAAHWTGPTPFLDKGEGTFFLLLSDGGQRTMHCDPDRITTSAVFKEAAAQAFSYEIYRTTICPTVPRLTDVSHVGQPCQAVIAATEQICRVPVPPGRLLVRQHVAFLDMRLVHEDVSWCLAPHGVLDMDRLVAPYADKTPHGHALSITGGRQEVRGSRTFLHVAHGELLRYAFVESGPATPSPGHSGSRPSTNPDDSEASESEDDSTADPPASMSDTALTLEPAGRTMERSRSPPPRAAQGLHKGLVHLTPLHNLRLPWDDGMLALLQGWFVYLPKNPSKIRPTHLARDSAVATGTAFSPCVYTAPPRHTSLALHVLGDGLTAKECKFLQEPISHTRAGSQDLHDLRTLTHQLGGIWLTRDIRFVPDELLQEAPGPVVGAQDDEQLCDLPCAVLKIDYVPEMLKITLSLPAILPEAEAALHRVRDHTLRTLFPVLMPVLPQPLDGVACYLATPTWVNGLQCACLDATRVDGRIFASHLPAYVARHTLLALAGFPCRVRHYRMARHGIIQA